MDSSEARSIESVEFRPDDAIPAGDAANTDAWFTDPDGRPGRARDRPPAHPARSDARAR